MKTRKWNDDDDDDEMMKWMMMNQLEMSVNRSPKQIQTDRSNQIYFRSVFFFTIFSPKTSIIKLKHWIPFVFLRNEKLPKTLVQSFDSDFATIELVTKLKNCLIWSSLVGVCVCVCSRLMFSSKWKNRLGASYKRNNYLREKTKPNEMENNQVGFVASKRKREKLLKILAIKLKQKNSSQIWEWNWNYNKKWLKNGKKWW